MSTTDESAATPTNDVIPLRPRRQSEQWVEQLRPGHPRRDQTVAKLHEVLIRVAFHELSRRRGQLRAISGPEFDDLAHQAADDALMKVLAKLDEFRGRSRFTTWAYKFVVLEAAVLARRRAWAGREVCLSDRDWTALEPTAQQILEDAEVLAVVRDTLRNRMTPHQRSVFIALALDGVPIDVLAERIGTTRGALYKVLHDARRKLRAAVGEAT
jgi:RNA polymerase sigma-70 factor, ECF subfamily